MKTLTPYQQARARELAGRISGVKIADEIGCPFWILKKWAVVNQVSLDSRRKYPKELVSKLLKYYEKHGRSETAKKFNLDLFAVISITATANGQYKPRQQKWSQRDLLELLRMAGIISPKAQTQFFNRKAGPYTIRGSLRRHFNLGGEIHGLPKSKAEHLTQDANYIFVNGGKRMCLWVEMERHLKPSVPDFVRDSVKAMANFQRWLYECDDVLQAVKRMIAEREICD